MPRYLYFERSHIIFLKLNDLRSAISKEACKLVTIAAEYGQELIENLCDKLLSKQCLLKLINSATRIISENSHECIITLLNYIRCSKVIPRIIEEANSKSVAVRQKISQYINIVVDIYEHPILEKYQHMLEEAISTLICDANKEVRQFTRQTFSIYSEKFPSRGEKLFSTFDASVTKTLIDEGLAEPTVAYLKKASSISSAKEIKSAQRPSSSSAKKGDSKSVYSSPTSALGRTSSNGFGSENLVKGSPLTRSTTATFDDERPPRQSDVHAERKVSMSKNRAGFEKKKSVEISSAEIKSREIPVSKGSNSLAVSKSSSEESTRPPTRASSKVTND